MSIDNSKGKTVKLHLPAINKQISNFERNRVGKEVRWKLLKPLVKLLSGVEIEPVDNSSPEIMAILRKACNDKECHRLQIVDLIKLYRSFTSDIANIYTCAALDPALEKTWQDILYFPELGINDIEKFLGRKIEVVSKGSWRGEYDLDILFYPLVVVQSPYYYGYFEDDDRTEFRFSLSPENRKKLIDYFYGDEFLSPEKEAELPENLNLEIENFEKAIASDVSFLSNLLLTDNNSTGSPLTASKLKALKKSFVSPDFKSKEEPALDRVQFVANSYFLFNNFRKSLSKSSQETVSAFAKFVKDYMPSQVRGTWFGMFFPEYKGFTQRWSYYSNAAEMTEILYNFIKNGKDEWLSLEKLQFFYLCSTLPKVRIPSYIHLFSYDARSKSRLRPVDEKSSFKMYMNGLSWFLDIDFPFLIRWIKLLCAVGILETAGLSDVSFYDDPFGGLKYIRLTALGRYVFGFEKTYKAPEVEKKKEIDVDESQCIVTVLTDNCPHKLFLSRVARQISSCRYLFSPESLTKGCQTAKMVMERIENLKKIIKIEDFPHFKEMIDQTMGRLNSMTNIPGDFVIYKISTRYPELVELITTDQDITADNVIPALGGRILVKRSFLQEFKCICANHGFYFS